MLATLKEGFIQWQYLAANGEKINKLTLGKSTKVELGASDAILNFSVAGFSSDADTIQEKAPSITQYIQRYFTEKSGEKDGYHTRLIRGAFKEVQKEQKRKYFIPRSLHLIM